MNSKLLLVSVIVLSLIASCTSTPTPKSESIENEGSVLTLLQIERNKKFDAGPGGLVMYTPKGKEYIIFRVKIEGKAASLKTAKLTDKAGNSYDSVMRYVTPMENEEREFPFFISKGTQPHMLNIGKFCFEFK